MNECANMYGSIQTLEMTQFEKEITAVDEKFASLPEKHKDAPHRDTSSPPIKGCEIHGTWFCKQMTENVLKTTKNKLTTS